MGSMQKNETRYIYKILPGGEMINTFHYADFENSVFKEGTFRWCFKGKIKNINGKSVTTQDFPSGGCVVKVYKNINYMQDYYIDMLCSQYAHEKAILFNRQIGITNKLNFIIPYAGSIQILAGFKLFGLFKVSTDDEAKPYLKKDMKFAIEPFLIWRIY